jgi:DNA-binding transcriptional LysR family regulator
MSEAWTWTLRDADGADTMVRINSRLRSDNSEFLLQAALAGRGLLMASELHIREQLEAGRLVRVLPGHEVAADSGVFALYPGGKHVLPRLRVFLNFLADWFSRDVDARGRSPCPGHASALTAGR